MNRPRKQTLEYAGLLCAAFAAGLGTGWTDLGHRIDRDAYDWIFQSVRPKAGPPQATVLAIDDADIRHAGGVRGLRRTVAEGLELAARGKPAALAIDVVLSDSGEPADDARIEDAIRRFPAPVILACDLLKDRGWEEPLPRFRRAAAGVGHVHGEPDPVSREILLAKVAGRERRWALALEAFRVSRHAKILETPSDLEVAGVLIPAPVRGDRALRIRYRPPEDPIPQITIGQLRARPELASSFDGKVVFLGVTSPLVARDRLQTPYSSGSEATFGVEIHANVFDTIAQGSFLANISDTGTVLLCALFAALAGLIFHHLSGWPAYGAAIVLMLTAHLSPYVLFARSLVLPFTAPISTVWLASVSAAAYQYFIVRRRMLKAEGDRARYQQTMHFVTHEMRTPLTAIQGSSELIGRYALTDEKRKQMAQMINSESKRLANMVSIFLNLERLSATQFELKREPFAAGELMQACIERVRPIADRKKIQVDLEPFDATLNGDRELMEYAFYNLLTNAVKYSPANTRVSVYARHNGGGTRISVQDQGIGMDAKEVKQVFQKFYRTKKAEETGEPGTGIGLSIVEQIVLQHGGRIEVASSPGQGSCFTLVL